MFNNSWEEHIAALTNIMQTLQRELSAVTEERDRLLKERDSLLKGRETLLEQTANPEPHERLWIPGEEPPK